MSKRRKIGDKVKTIFGIVTISKDMEMTCNMGCDDPDCWEWFGINENGEEIPHIAECMMEDTECQN